MGETRREGSHLVTSQALKDVKQDKRELYPVPLSINSTEGQRQRKRLFLGGKESNSMNIHNTKHQKVYESCYTKTSHTNLFSINQNFAEETVIFFLSAQPHCSERLGAWLGRNSYPFANWSPSTAASRSAESFDHLVPGASFYTERRRES